jgi:hypothetical protein
MAFDHLPSACVHLQHRRSAGQAIGGNLYLGFMAQAELSEEVRDGCPHRSATHEQLFLPDFWWREN